MICIYIIYHHISSIDQLPSLQHTQGANRTQGSQSVVLTWFHGGFHTPYMGNPQMDDLEWTIP